MSAATLLDRLSAVRQTGPGRWLARCPAHEDGSPSLSIRELDDGRVLLHDFGGCGTHAVLEALGFEMAALFPERLRGTGSAGGFSRTNSRIAATDALAALDHELTVACTLIEATRTGNQLDDADLARLHQAAARIGAARDLCVPQEVRRVA